MSNTSPEESIFFAALQTRDDADRAAYLAGACGPDLPLRERVESLLAAYNAGEFLESPATELTATALLAPVGEQPGDTIGPYKLLEQIGEGGMGLVFMADQSQPLRRRVALKIIKPGLDTRAVIARFEAERQALALMDHPNIARVFDAGATDSGRPYFVMELVRGVPITQYCNERELELKARLELFINVCQAVQHAHQKGIIHRDLKPTNILVAHDDTTPVPKVIDFGVAKATSQQLTDHTLFTHFAQVIGTPLYMSPEQAELNYRDVDTRSDVYSLGVVLYELVTGTTPFDAERLRRAGVDEMRRIIREEEPPKPSTRVTTVAAATTSESPKRTSGPIVASLSLKGDLDWIVMKSLDKDRRRRYESPGAVAADIRRFLEDLPIEAAAPTVIYRMRKFARRNRSRLMNTGVLALLLVAVVAAFAVTAIQRRKELADSKRQIGESLASARTAIAAQNLGLAETSMAEVRTLLRQVPVALSSFAMEMERIEGEIAQNRAEQERFAQFTGEAIRAQDFMFYESSRDEPKAEDVLALYGVLADAEWFQTVAGSSLSDEQKEQVRQLAYTTLLCLADHQIRAKKNRNREKARQCLELLEKAKGIREPTRGFYWVRSQANALIGDHSAKQADLGRMKTAPESFAWDYFLEGHTSGWNGDVDAAMAAYQKALRIEPDHFNSLFFLGMRYGEVKGDYVAGVAYFTACLALRPDSYMSYSNRGIGHFFLKNWEEAAKDFTAARNIRQSPGTYWLFLRAAAYDQMKQADEARQDRLSAIKKTREILESSPEKLGEHHIYAIAISAENCSDDKMTVELWRLALSAAKSIPATKDALVAQMYAGLGYSLHKQGDNLEAERTLREGITLCDNNLADSWVRFQLSSYLGSVRASQRRPDEAEPLLISGYEGIMVRRGQIMPEERHYLNESRDRLIDFYKASGRADEAQRWRDKAKSEQATSN